VVGLLTFGHNMQLGAARGTRNVRKWWNLDATDSEHEILKLSARQHAVRRPARGHVISTHVERWTAIIWA